MYEICIKFYFKFYHFFFFKKISFNNFYIKLHFEVYDKIELEYQKSIEENSPLFFITF